MIRCSVIARWVLFPLLAASWANVARAQSAYADAVVSVQAGSGLGLAPAIHSQGDADYNEQVNALDMAIWRDQFGAGMTAAAVPEPASVGLIGFGALWGASVLPRGRVKRA